MSTHDFWTPNGFARATGGRLLRPGHTELAGISTDTRAIQPGQAFLALNGDTFDGHHFLEQAVQAGAAMLVVSDEAAVPDGASALVVGDTLTALQQLAAAWRDVLREHGCKVIAITGSNGKTTTRHLVHSVLSSGGAGLVGTQSPKSFNNHIGVPLTLLAAKAEDDFVVAEMGMNHAGEIGVLADIARPDAAAVTHVGRAHIGLLGSREAIAREKASIFGALSRHGLAVLPASTHWPEQTMPNPACAAVVRFDAAPEPADDADLFLEGHTLSADGTQSFVAASRDGARLPLHMPLPGAHNAGNTLIAVAIARWMGVSDSAIAQGVSRLTGAPMRLEHVSIGKPPRQIVVINDAYNANPDSMAAALSHLAACDPPAPGGRRVAVLGDMFELGDEADHEHRALADTIDTMGADVAVLIGEMTMFTGDELRSRWDASRVLSLGPWSENVPGAVAQAVQPGDVVLLKASRGMALERLIPALEEKMARGA